MIVIYTAFITLSDLVNYSEVPLPKIRNIKTSSGLGLQ